LKRAEWAGATLAESDDIVMVEGNAYFPEAAIRREHFVPSDKTTVCPWKGTANYYSVRVDGLTNENVAWYYAKPKAAAQQIAGRIAFWRGVTVRDV
jgi:uncharacterized protein (DUF427 family)